MDDKAQISFEFFIIVAGMAAFALLLISQLTSTSHSTKDSFKNTSDDLIKAIENITKE